MLENLDTMAPFVAVDWCDFITDYLDEQPSQAGAAQRRPLPSLRGFASSPVVFEPYVTPLA